MHATQSLHRDPQASKAKLNSSWMTSLSNWQLLRNGFGFPETRSGTCTIGQREDLPTAPRPSSPNAISCVDSLSLDSKVYWLCQVKRISCEILVMGKRKRYSDHQADPPDEDTQKETPTRKAGRVKFKHVAKLLSLAAEGKHKKIRGYVERKALDVNAYNSEGLTALHQVCLKSARSSNHMCTPQYYHEYVFCNLIHFSSIAFALRCCS